jgi:hypothetical protein
MAEATDLLLEYIALKDLISSLFLLSRIFPYDTAILIPIPAIRISSRKGSTSQVRSRVLESLCVTPPAH